MNAVPNARASILPWLGLALLIILVDQVTKVAVVDNFVLNDSLRITSFFNLVRVHNAGAAFSFLASASGWQRWFFTVLGLVAGAFIVWMLARHRGQRLFSAALALILGGAIGNVIDRLVHGHVIDFIQVHAGGWYFPAFNVADGAITVGAVLLIWDEIRRMRRAA